MSDVLRSRKAPSWADRLAVLVGSFGLTGFFPVAPATFASAVATLLLVWVYPLASLLEYGVLCTGLFVVGVWSSGRLERLYGSDPSAAVIDEVLGMALTLAWAPIQPFTVVLGFLLFRVFDILKLPPGRALERLPGGWGVMADDACAGLYAALVLYGVLRLWPEPRLAVWQLVPVGLGVVLLVLFRKPLVARYGKSRCDPRRGFAANTLKPNKPAKGGSR